LIYRRGDVVLAWFPLASGAGGSRRPVLAIQNDVDNLRLRNTVVAQITTNLARAGEPTHLLIEAATSEGRRAGLLHDSLVSCVNLATINESEIQRKIGQLGPTELARVDACLAVALGLP